MSGGTPQALALTPNGRGGAWGKQNVIVFAPDAATPLWRVNADGTNVRRLTKHNAEDSNPAWGPDGKSIAYISATSNDRRGLFVMNADGSEPQGLVHSKNQDFCFPSWSSDGKLIIISSLNRLGSQGIVPGEEKPRCEQWSGEYQIFAVTDDLKMKLLSDTRVMGTRPSYGRIATP